MMAKEEPYNDYYTLPCHTSQMIIWYLDKSWKAFFKSFKDWQTHPDKYKSQPRPPNYKEKDGEHILIFTTSQCKIKKGILKFPKMVNLEVKTRLPDNTNLREVRIVPKGCGYSVEIVYKKDIPDQKPKKNRIAGIDIGLVNLITAGDNIGNDPIIIKGGAVKSINQFYNKEKARLKSIYDHQGIKNGYKLEKLTRKRNNKLKDCMHKACRSIVHVFQERGIDTIIIGHNNGWKQDINLGKQTNQNFVMVPVNWLINMISYKGQELGMETKVQEESHTSKCSFLDQEPVEHRDKYVGKRISRGRFRSANGTIINADVNAFYNIIRKAVPGAFANGIEGVRMNPRRLSI
jgi:putative transposase